MATKRTVIRIAPVSLKLDNSERQRLAALAVARKRSSHYLMREAVREYLGREEARQSFRLEASEAWRDYKESDLHVTQVEVDTWVASLAEAKPKRTPKWQK